MSKRQIFIIIISGITLLLYYYIKDRQQNVEKIIRELETGRKVETPQERSDRFDKQKEVLEQSKRLIKENRILEASTQFYRVRNYFRDNRDPKIKEWYDSYLPTYRDTLFQHLPKFIRKFEYGDISISDFKQVSTNYSYSGLEEVKDYYQKNEGRINQNRTINAVNWVRVYFQSYLPEIEDTLFKALAEKNSHNDLRFVSGSYYSYEENRATFKVLTIKIDKKEANYTIKQRSNNSYIAAPRIPYQLDLSFKITNSKDIDTSWDKLSPISEVVDIPKTIYLEESSDKGERITQEKVNLLIDQVMSRVEQLPEFEIFPDKGNNISLLENRRFNYENGLALYYKDRYKLHSEVRKLIAKGKHRGDLIKLIIQLDLEDYLPFVTKNIYKLNDRELRSVTEVYQLKPYFGNYKPLLSLIERTDQFPYQLLNAVKNFPEIPGFEDILYNKIFSVKGYNRSNYAGFYINYAKKENLTEKIPNLLDSRDKNFVNSSYNNLKNRIGDEVDTYMLKHYDSLNSNLKLLFLNRFNYDKSKHTITDFELLKREAVNFNQSKIQEAAINNLLKQKNSKEGWEALYEASKSYRNKIKKERLESQLIYAARFAKSDLSNDFLHEKLLQSKDDRVRGDAAHQLMDSDDDKSAIFKLLNRITKNSEKLLKRVCNSVLQFYKLRKNFDLHNDDLIEIINRGSKIKDKRFQNRLEKFKEYARSIGEMGYE